MLTLTDVSLTVTHGSLQQPELGIPRIYPWGGSQTGMEGTNVVRGNAYDWSEIRSNCDTIISKHSNDLDTLLESLGPTEVPAT